MGYFNYFIKCIIRNITYKLCKPKVFLTVLFSVCILFGLRHYGFCSDLQLDTIIDQLAVVTENQAHIANQLSDMGINVANIKVELNSINQELDNIGAYTSNINTNLITLLNRINSMNTTLTQLAEQQNIYYENMTEEIRTIRDALVGSDDTPFTAEYVGIVNATHAGGYTPGLRIYKIPMIKNYTYKINITYVNNESNAIGVKYLLSSVAVSSGGVIPDASLVTLGTVPANSSATFTIYTRDDTRPYLYLSYGYNNITVTGTASIEGIVDILDRTNQDVVDNIQQGNQLQQEQNQLQQEQNDFLKQESSSSDVSVDGFNSVDSNDITSEGLTGVFTNIYNSISSWSSKDINLPIPYTNKSIVIPANYTHNMLSSFGGSWIISFISSIYYFIVARFIIYSITSIINSIKSGSILETDSKNNITTDML